MITGIGSYDNKIDAPIDLARKIAISSSTGPGNGFVSGAIDIYHKALRVGNQLQFHDR